MKLPMCRDCRWSDRRTVLFADFSKCSHPATIATSRNGTPTYCRVMRNGLVPEPCGPTGKLFEQRPSPWRRILAKLPILALLAVAAWGQTKPTCVNGTIRYTPERILWEECKENKWVQVGEPWSPKDAIAVYPEQWIPPDHQQSLLIERLEKRISELEKIVASQETAINTITAILAEAAVHARAMEKRIAELERPPVVDIKGGTVAPCDPTLKYTKAEAVNCVGGLWRIPRAHKK